MLHTPVTALEKYFLLKKIKVRSNLMKPHWLLIGSWWLSTCGGIYVQIEKKLQSIVHIPSCNGLRLGEILSHEAAIHKTNSSRAWQYFWNISIWLKTNLALIWFSNSVWCIHLVHYCKRMKGSNEYNNTTEFNPFQWVAYVNYSKLITKQPCYHIDVLIVLT